MATSFRYSKANVLLDINNVSVAYDDRVILKNLSAQVVDIQRPGMTAGQIVGFERFLEGRGSVALVWERRRCSVSCRG